MKTLVVLSDSHGRRENVRAVSPLFAENDYFVHLGDGASDVRAYVTQFPERAVVLKGNCDFSSASDERVLSVEGVKILCCHGHRYGVKSGLSRLVARAEELGCSVALYGHTHRAEIRETGSVLCINPGSLGSHTAPSYCYLAVHEGKITPAIVPLRPQSGVFSD